MSATPQRQAKDVRFAGVRKNFGPAVALHTFDLDIPRGTLFSLLGPSGCGKTTTLRLIAGFEQPSAGTVTIGDRNVTGVPAHKRNFGMVFQNFALFPHLSVSENVAFGLQMRRLPKAEIGERVAKALSLVALDRFAERYPRQLSGGQQQRVALARAVVFEPDVLLLDEPLSALDKMLRDQMQIEIRQLQQRLGMTTVFVTHDQEEALTMSDQVAVMSEGRVQQVGPPRAIYENPSNEFVARFLGSSNIVTARVVGRDADSVVADVAGSRVLLAPSPETTDGTVRFAVRPERIMVAREGAAGAAAVLRQCVFKGAQTHLLFDLAGEPVSATVPNTVADALDLQPGETAYLTWEQGAAVVLAGPAT
jgi:spermidine/putrescine ABC transporter ATP-binding subunit